MKNTKDLHQVTLKLTTPSFPSACIVYTPAISPLTHYLQDEHAFDEHHKNAKNMFKRTSLLNFKLVEIFEALNEESSDFLRKNLLFLVTVNLTSKSPE